MIPSHFGLKWKDAINSILIMLASNALMIITQAAEGEFPSLLEFRNGAIATLKYGVAPYILKNFFSNDIKNAQKTLSAAKVEGAEAAQDIPPPVTDKVDISKFPPSATVPGKQE